MGDAFAHVNEEVIYSRACKKAHSMGKEITFNTLKFFMRFISLAERDGNGYYVAKASKVIATEVLMPERTVSYCLKSLSDCGILLGKRGKPTIWRVDCSVLNVNEVFP